MPKPISSDVLIIGAGTARQAVAATAPSVARILQSGEA